MSIVEQLINQWFDIWSNGNFEDLPLSQDFRHTSPYGIVEGKDSYLNLIEKNKSSFLGNQFKVHEVIYSEDKASVRYTMNDSMEISEWFYLKDDLINEVVSYYNIKG